MFRDLGVWGLGFLGCGVQGGAFSRGPLGLSRVGAL